MAIYKILTPMSK